MTTAEAKEQIQSIRYDYEIRMQKMGNCSIEERMDLNKKIALLTQEGEITKSSLLAQLEDKTKTYQRNMDSIKR